MTGADRLQVHTLSSHVTSARLFDYTRAMTLRDVSGDHAARSVTVGDRARQGRRLDTVSAQGWAERRGGELLHVRVDAVPPDRHATGDPAPRAAPQPRRRPDHQGRRREAGPAPAVPGAQRDR